MGEQVTQMEEVVPTLVMEVITLDNNGTSTNGFNSGNHNGGGFPRTNGNGNGGNILTCQLCGKVGHSAKTCRTLRNYNVNNTSSSFVECQYCGRPNHNADRCFHIIGFPN